MLDAAVLPTLAFGIGISPDAQVGCNGFACKQTDTTIYVNIQGIIHTFA